MFFALTTACLTLPCLNERLVQELAGYGSEDHSSAVQVATRFRYNQAFRSVDAMVPSTIALLLVFVPSILTALSVVREKELGTITNLYGTPVSKIEFLLGKQIPYVILALVNFFVMVLMAVTIFAVPLKGSLIGLALGAVVYVFATTAIGLLSSCITKTQMAAVFGTAIATMLPATQFSGMLQPVSTLKGTGYIIGTVFPTTYFCCQCRCVLHRIDICRCFAIHLLMAVIPAWQFFAACNVPSAKTGGIALSRIRNIMQLTWKELISLRRDTFMVIFVIYSFSFAVYSQATGISQELADASIAVVDEDHSALAPTYRRQDRAAALPASGCARA